jgi:hypothetical protein
MNNQYVSPSTTGLRSWRVSRCLIAPVLLLLMLFASLGSASATEGFTATVDVDSAFARALPAFDAAETASVFEGERLEAVSRNLDGTWFEVRRPGRMNKLGWIFAATLEWDFLPELLPLGDLTTGVIGPDVLNFTPESAVFLVESPTLRTQPIRTSPRVPGVVIPFSVTVPVISRNQDGTWLYINYLGYQGWVIAFAGRPVPNLMDILPAPNLPPLENVSTLIIPVEIQQAQIDRLRAFAQDRLAYAQGLESFWWRVFRGEIMPCNAPPELLNYPYTDNDVRELPELGRYAPRLETGVDYLRTSQSLLNECGVVSPVGVVDARDAAINARIIFNSTLGSLASLEEFVVNRDR